MKMKKTFATSVIAVMLCFGFVLPTLARDYECRGTKSVYTQYGYATVNATAIHHTLGNKRWDYSATGGANTTVSHSVKYMSNTYLDLNVSAGLRVGNQTGYGSTTFYFTMNGSGVTVK